MRQAALSPSVPTSASAGIPLPAMVGIFCVLWSSAFGAAKIAIADCPPLLLLGTRFLMAGILMLGAAKLQGARWTLGRRAVVLFAALGIANQAIYLGLGYIGLREVSSGLSVIIVSTAPIATAVLAYLALGERMTWGKSLGLLLGVGGVAFIVESRLSIGGDDHLRGILLSIAAMLSLVGGTILFKRFAPKDGLWLGNGVQSLAAGIATMPFALTFESVGDVVPTWRLLVAFAYLLIVSVFAYLLWFRILTVSGATAASSYYFLMPPLGMLFGWLLLGEQVAFADMLGIVPVVFGIYLVTRPVSRV